MIQHRLVPVESWRILRRIVGVFLIVQLGLGVVTVPNAFAATFYVNAATGSDANSAAQAQNPATPWQTLTRALEGTAVDGAPNPELSAGDTVQVAAGTYDAALGEQYPLFLIDGVTISGAGPGLSILEASTSQTAVFENVDTPLQAGTTLTGFTLRNSGQSSSGLILLDMESLSSPIVMAPTIRNNAFENGRFGINSFLDADGLAPDFRPLVENNTFSALSAIAIDISVSDYGNGSTTEGDVSPVIQNNTFTGVDGIDFFLSESISGALAEPVISHNTFDASGSTSFLQGISIGFVMSESSESFGTLRPTISHNTFLGVRTAIDLSIYGETSAAFTVDATITSNTISGGQGDGINVDITEATETASFDVDFLIAGNSITGGTNGIDFSFTEQESGEVFDLVATVRDNIISNTTDDGIYFNVDSISANTLEQLVVTIEGNTVSGAGEDGLDIALTDLSNGASRGSAAVLIAGNTVTGSGANGIALSASDLTTFDQTATVEVRDNWISGSGGYGLDAYLVNTGATTVHCNVIRDNPGGGILNESSEADYGGGSSGSPGLNTISGNTTTGNFDFANQSATTVSATNNYWGTTSASTIAANIRDGNDAGGQGTVNFSPFLQTPPTAALDVSITSAIVIDQGVPGSSAGDTIKFTATLTGVGQCGTSGALFESQIPPGFELDPASIVLMPADSGEIIWDGDPPAAVKVQFGNVPTGETFTVMWQGTIISGGPFDGESTVTTPQTGPIVVSVPIATVTIPTLGGWGLALLVALLSLAGLAFLRRGFGSAAALLLGGVLLVGGARAMEETARSAPDRDQRGKIARTAGERREVEAAAVLTSFDVDPATREVTVGLSDGTEIRLPRSQVRVKDKRLRADLPGAKTGPKVASAAMIEHAKKQMVGIRKLRPQLIQQALIGQPVLAKTRLRGDRPTKLKLELFPSLETAQASIKHAIADR